MELTVWQVSGLMFAGCLMTLIGALVAGILVYKTKYAGKSLIADKEPDLKAEAFNLDDGFMEDLLDPAEEVELPEPIDAANKKFLKQFNADRLVKAGEKEREAV